MNKLPHILSTAMLVAAISSPAAEANSSATAKHFMQGGTFCFSQGESIAGGKIKTIKMVVSKAAGGSLNEVAHIDALMFGWQATFPIRSFFDEVTGAATIAPPNDLLPGDQQVQVALTGTSYGTDGDTSKPGVWTVNYAATLDTTDLRGRITGVTVFNPIKNGKLGTSAKYAVDDALKPISCDEFGLH